MAMHSFGCAVRSTLLVLSLMNAGMPSGSWSPYLQLIDPYPDVGAAYLAA